MVFLTMGDFRVQMYLFLSADRDYFCIFSQSNFVPLCFPISSKIFEIQRQVVSSSVSELTRHCYFLNYTYEIKV